MFLTPLGGGRESRRGKEQELKLLKFKANLLSLSLPLDWKLLNWSQHWPIQKGHNKQPNVSKVSHGVYVSLWVTADRVYWIATTWLKRLPHFLPQGESTPGGTHTHTHTYVLTVYVHNIFILYIQSVYNQGILSAQPPKLSI